MTRKEFNERIDRLKDLGTELGYLLNFESLFDLQYNRLEEMMNKQEEIQRDKYNMKLYIKYTEIREGVIKLIEYSALTEIDALFKTNPEQAIMRLAEIKSDLQKRVLRDRLNIEYGILRKKIDDTIDRNDKSELNDLLNIISKLNK